MNEITSHRNWRCPKCEHVEFETDEFAATGGGLSKIFDVQNKRFTTVSCARCRFTEIYKADTSSLGNILDFFTG
ncbi:MAG: zinc ribbon domain-containing protein [Calditrichaeota bacterium]|nr:zinc ribbon domain-containing protein [Calditrichota bacterium]